MAKPIVIVGAGLAGTQAAQSLRELGYDGELILIGEEPHPPYQRAQLSKGFLAGTASQDDLRLHAPDFFSKNKITFRAGTRVNALDPVAKTLWLDDGDELGYDKVLLAMGTRAREKDVAGKDLAGVVTLRKIDDVAYMRPLSGKGKRVVIVGGGYIGLEVASVMRAGGAEVTVVEQGERVMQRIVSPFVSEFFEALHRANGVDIRLGTTVRRFSGRGAVETARLDSGEMLDVDLVVVTTGAIPNDEIATAAGITTDDGIIVDATGHSTTPDVYAAGDCARFFSAHYGREIRLESVQNAIDQAKVAAAGMLGRTVQYDPVPCFSSQQYDVTLRIAGLSQYHDETHVVGSRESGKFAVYYLHEGRLFAVDAVNDEKAHLAAIKQIGKEWAPAEA